MTKKILKNLLAFAFVMMLVLPVAVDAASLNLGTEYAGNLGLSNGNGQTPQGMAITIVRWFMTFLGIVATVVILLGGFKWMTAGGNEDKVGEAKKLLAAGIIGLIIVLAAFAIVTWVVSTSQGMLVNGSM